VADVSRRDFVVVSTLAGAGFVALPRATDAASVAGGPTRVGPGSDPGRTPTAASEADWFDRPMRWAQLTLVETDPGRYDPQLWLDYFTRIHADAACLSAGGVVAYYPTAIPLHHRSAWLGDADPFGELVAGCRSRNMVVIARTDPHATHQNVYDAHPDWIAVDASGQKRRNREDATNAKDTKKQP
jgi:Hypothetical glycosyl hydrolase 6